MPRHGTLRGVGLTALGAVVVAGSFDALGLRPAGIARYYRDTLTPAGFAIWFCGFVAATLAPPAIAVLCWFGAMRIRRSEEQTSELQSLMSNSYADLCLKKKKTTTNTDNDNH